MSRQRASPQIQPRRASPVKRVGRKLGDLIERASFCVLVALLCARPLLSETYDPSTLSLLESIEDDGGTTPATSAWLDTLMLAASIGLIARNVFHVKPICWIAAALLLVAVILSTVAAGDRWMAELAGESLLAAALAGIALYCGLRTPAAARLLLAGMLATGVTTAAKCVAQKSYEFRETLEYWEQEVKPRLLAQGRTPEDPLVVNFERRMASSEPFGFLSHPNIAGSCSMMWLLAAGGACIALRGDRRMIGGLLLCVLLGAALWLTDSKGAILGAAFGIAMLVLLAWKSAYIRGHVRKFAAVLLGSYVALIAAVGVYGAARGTLPGASLAFRWQYWTAAGRVWLDSPLTGIGRGNFSDAFLRYKTIESTEEVKDPHSVWVTLLVELGPLGLAGFATLVVVALAAGLAALAPVPAGEGPDPAPSAPRTGPLVFGAIRVALGVILLHMLCWDSPTLAVQGIDAWWRHVTARWAPTCGLQVGVLWPAALVLCLWVLDGVPDAYSRRRWLVAGLTAALLAALVHNLIDFALVVPAGVAVFVACAALAARGMGQRVPENAGATAVERVRRHPVWIRRVVVLMLLALQIQLIRNATGTTWDERAVEALETAVRTTDPRRGTDSLAGPLNHVWLTSFYTAEPSSRGAQLVAGWALAGEQLGADPRDGLHAAYGLALTASGRNTKSGGVRRQAAALQEQISRVEEARGRNFEAERAQGQACEHWEQAVERYPTDPRVHISAARALVRLWRMTGAADAAERAAAHLREALRIDAHRKPEEAAKLTARERDEVQELQGELRAGGYE
jgi:O-antigen ligase